MVMSGIGRSLASADRWSERVPQAELVAYPARGRASGSRLAVFLMALLAGTNLTAARASEAMSLRFMNGTWQGEGYVVHLDTERLLANLDPAKPFQREALIIRNITDGMVIFSVGERQFIGLFEGDALALSGESLGRTIRLDRWPSPRAPSGKGKAGASR